MGKKGMKGQSRGKKGNQGTMTMKGKNRGKKGKTANGLLDSEWNWCARGSSYVRGGQFSVGLESGIC